MKVKTVFLFFGLLPGFLTAQETSRLSLLFLGDIMQHDSQIAAAYQTEKGAYDYSDCFRWIAPHLQAADLTIGNLELTFAGAPYKGYPQFSAPDALARTLKQAGVDVLVTANNHSMDRGRKGVERTLDVLRQEEILATGTFKDSAERAQHYPLLIEKNGFRISLLNYTYGTNGIPVPKPTLVNLIDTLQIKLDLVAARRQRPDVVIVFFHWGYEYQPQPNAMQKMLARLCFREGVQLVIGAHPHVIQPMEWNRVSNQLVAYSLGNFVSGQRPRFRDGGATLRVELKKTGIDSLSKTEIESANYHLQWVYRDTRQRYYVVPAADFEQDTLLLSSALPRQALRQFLSDSRTLFNTNNMAVAEDTTSAFRVWITNDAMLDDVPQLRLFRTQRYALGGRVSWVTDEFSDAAAALKAAHEIAGQTSYRYAAVLRTARRKD